MIFLDTTIWVSGIDETDALHEDGKAVMEGVAGRTLPIALTTDFVLDETLTLLKKRGSRASKVRAAIGKILASSRVRILYVDDRLFKESLDVFENYEKLSFTDSVTLATMRRLKVKEIYSHDSDFDLKGIVRRETV